MIEFLICRCKCEFDVTRYFDYKNVQLALSILYFYYNIVELRLLVASLVEQFGFRTINLKEIGFGPVTEPGTRLLVRFSNKKFERYWIHFSNRILFSPSSKISFS